MSMQSKLSQEEQNLFNPSYSGLMVYETIRQYQAAKPEGMPCTLVFLAYPISSSSQISSSLPLSVSTPIASWVTSNEGVIVRLASLVESYVEITISALGFLLDAKLLELTEDGMLKTGGNSIPKAPGYVTNNMDVKSGFRAAGFVGRWFSSVSSAETIYAQLGVRP